MYDLDSLEQHFALRCLLTHFLSSHFHSVFLYFSYSSFHLTLTLSCHFRMLSFLHFRKLSLELLSLLRFVVVFQRLDLLIDTQKESHRTRCNFRNVRKASIRNHIHRSRIGPYFSTIQIRHHCKCLHSDFRGRVLEMFQHKILGLSVGFLIMIFQHIVPNICNNVVEHVLSQLLVLTIEQLEK